MLINEHAQHSKQQLYASKDACVHACIQTFKQVSIVLNFTLQPSLTLVSTHWYQTIKQPKCVHKKLMPEQYPAFTNHNDNMTTPL